MPWPQVLAYLRLVTEEKKESLYATAIALRAAQATGQGWQQWLKSLGRRD